MNGLRIDQSRCLCDGLCVAVCPQGILGVDGCGCARVLDGAKRRCIACGHCGAVCPVDAISCPEDNEGELPMSVPPWSVSPELADIFMLSCRSTRRYTAAPVPRHDIDAMLAIARHAPTAGNTQKIRWIIADDRKKVSRIADLVMQWFADDVVQNPALIGGYDAKGMVDRYEEGIDGIMRGAPNAVFAITETSWRRGSHDASIAMTYFRFAAHARNIGSCWCGFAMSAAKHYAPLRTHLGLGAEECMHAAVFFGYPAITYEKIPARKPLNTHWL